MHDAKAGFDPNRRHKVTIMEDCVAQAKPLFFSRWLSFKKAILKTAKPVRLRCVNNKLAEYDVNIVEPEEFAADLDRLTNGKRVQFSRSYLRFFENARRRHINSRSQWRQILDRHLFPRNK